MGFTLRGVRLIDAETEFFDTDITINGTQIQAIGHSTDTQGDIIDATDMIAMPGFIDIHTHGGGGFNLHTVDAEEIRAYARWVATTGVTSFLIGVVGVAGSLPEEQLSVAVDAIEDMGTGAEPLGIHMEGPYISVIRRGAHPPEWLRMPNVAEMERVLALAKGHLRLIALAPELPGAPAMIRQLVDAGVTVSIGHTDATYQQALEAIPLGITHITHCFNAMRPIHHRTPGPIEAIAQVEQVRGELIADGIHVHPATMNILVRILGPKRIVVITDAQAGAGIPNATFNFAGQPAKVIRGAARLSDGTLAGSILTMDQALRNMLQMTEVSLQEAVGMLTLNPAQAVQASERKGLLQRGYDADVLLFDSTLNLQATFCRGTLVFATDTWRERLKRG